MEKSLREILEDKAGFEECEFLIPHIFLPPRFKKLAPGHNMILFLDIDMVIHVKWEGKRVEEHHPLTPGATRRLLREVSRNMTRYRRDMGVVARFLERKAEEPFWDPRVDSLTQEREEQDAEPEEGEEIVAILHGDEIIEGPISELMGLGGEGPLADFDW